MAVLVVGAIHVLVTVALYAARVKHGFGGGDLVVFALPALMAVVGYYFAVAWRLTSPKVGHAFAAGALALVSFCTSMLINLNVYGS